MNAKNIVAWVLAVVLAFAFFASGALKLTSQTMPVGMFATFGLPPWFMYLTGALEIVCAMLLLIPRTAWIGASLVVCIMICAVMEHLSHGQAGMVAPPLVLLVLAVCLGTLRGWGRGVRVRVAG